MLGQKGVDRFTATSQFVVCVKRKKNEIILNKGKRKHITNLVHVLAGALSRDLILTALGSP